LAKKAKAIHMSDEVLLGSVLPLLKPWLRRVGVMMGAGLNKQIVGVLVNGDQPSGDECAVVGTETGNSLVQTDFYRVWSRGSRLSYFWHSMVTTEEMSVELSDLDMFSKPQGAGNVQVQLEPFQKVRPDKMPHYISGATDLAADQVLLVDPALAAVHLTYMPLRVESERIVMRQLQGTVVSVIQGYATVDRRARIIIDKNTAFSSAGFPAWMTPLD
jgi:hypothetical protein